jgi:ubiquinone/menaquinone biosynthesis C-methylase UbiE
VVWVIVGAVLVAILAGAVWWRRNPSACPYSQRFWVEAPHPMITRDRLRKVLAPKDGERILEIGPGTGYYTLDMAEWVGPTGKVEIFDIQQEFLDHTMKRAGERGLQNVVPTQGNATDLPYGDDSVDAVVLVAVLGEIPDPDAALREVARSLKPGGRLVIGELFGDPHFTTWASARRRCAAAGLIKAERSGNWLGYFARFAAEESPAELAARPASAESTPTA